MRLYVEQIDEAAGMAPSRIEQFHASHDHDQNSQANWSVEGTVRATQTWTRQQLRGVDISDNPFWLVTSVPCSPMVGSLVGGDSFNLQRGALFGV